MVVLVARRLTAPWVAWVVPRPRFPPSRPRQLAVLAVQADSQEMSQAAQVEWVAWVVRPLLPVPQELPQPVVRVVSVVRATSSGLRVQPAVLVVRRSSIPLRAHWQRVAGVAFAGRPAQVLEQQPLRRVAVRQLSGVEVQHPVTLELILLCDTVR